MNAAILEWKLTKKAEAQCFEKKKLKKVNKMWKQAGNNAKISMRTENFNENRKSDNKHIKVFVLKTWILASSFTKAIF